MEPVASAQAGTAETLRPSERVIEAVAEVEGCDPIELESPLNDAIDPDALDSLVPGDESRGADSVSFTYVGHRIVVRGDGSVRVDGR